MSIGCVWNVASMTCAASASAASTSPRENAVIGWRMFEDFGANVSDECTSGAPGFNASNGSMIGSSTS